MKKQILHGLGVVALASGMLHAAPGLAVETIKIDGNKIKHAFPGNSLTVIRVKAAK